MRAESVQAALMAELPPAAAALYDSLEFATALLWTCASHCFEESGTTTVTYTEEYVGVQADPVAIAVHERTERASGRA
jgi:hypothetical protein